MGQDRIRSVEETDRSAGMLNTGLRDLLLYVLNIDTIDYADTIETVGIWDSMMHIEIIVALEKKYSIRIEPDRIVALTSVRGIQGFLETKGVL